jgi:gliding motility-associated-like protein
MKYLKFIIILSFFSFLNNPINAAIYYWVGGSGYWSEISHWSASSGGNTFHAVVPSAFDTVFFDSNSGFTPGNNTITINTGATCYTLIWENAPATPNLIGTVNQSLSIFGSLVLQPDMNVDVGQSDFRWNFRSRQTGNTIRTNNQVIQAHGGVFFDGEGGEWTLLDGFSSGSRNIQLKEGILISNNQPIIANEIFSSYIYNRSLLLGNSIVTAGSFNFNGSNYNIVMDTCTVNVSSIYFEGSQYSVLIDSSTINTSDLIISGMGLAIEFGKSVFNINRSFTFSGSESSFDAGTSVLNFSSYSLLHEMTVNTSNVVFYNVNFLNPDIPVNGSRLHGNNTSFNNVVFTGNGLINGNNTFNELVLSVGKTYHLQSEATQTIISEFDATSQACSPPLNIFSTQSHFQAYISKATGTINCENLVLQDIHAIGGATFNAIATVDLGNNDGWIFTSPEPQSFFWIGGSGNWSDTERWSFESGGTTSDCIPTAFDDVFFDSNAGFSSGNNTVTIDVTAYCRNMTWDNSTNTPNLIGTINQNLSIFGSLVLQPDMNVDVGQSDFRWNFRSRQTGNTIRTNNQVIQAHGGVFFDGEGGEWTLLDGFSSGSRNIQLKEGILISNNQPIIANEIFSSYIYNRSLLLGNSIVTAGSFNFNGSNYNIVMDTCTVNVSSIYFEGSQYSVLIDSSTINTSDLIISGMGLAIEFGKSVFNINRSFTFSGSESSFDAGTSVLNFSSHSLLHEMTVNTSNVVFYNVNFLNPDIPVNGSRLHGNITSFNNVVFTGNGLINGSNTYNVLSLAHGCYYQVQSGQIQEITFDLIAKGNPCFIIHLYSSVSGEAAMFYKAIQDTVIVDFITLKDVHASGNAIFIGAPNAYDLGNNTGWDFTSLPGNYIFGFGQDITLNCNQLPYTITTENFNPNPGTRFLWNDSSSDSVLVINDFGVYSVEVIYADFCTYFDTIEFFSPPYPTVDLGPDTTICIGYVVTLDAGVHDSYLWSTGNNSREVSLNTEGVYWVKVYNEYFCEAYDEIIVSVNDQCVSFPNVFRPNSSININRTFKPIFLLPPTQFQMMIYDRWGFLIFETSIYNKGWDGKIDSQEAAFGVYAYTVSYLLPDGLVRFKKGSVMLLR